MDTVNPRGRRRVGWRRVLASLVAVALSGVVASGCTVTDLPECGESLVILFPALDFGAAPSASLWSNGFRICKEAIPLDYTEYSKNPRGYPCRLRRSGELFIPLADGTELTITARLNLYGKPGPERAFEVDFGDVEPDANGCRTQYVSF